MANDKMRTGPRGSADQVSWLGPKVVAFGAGPLAQVTEFDESGGGQGAFWAPFFPVEEGYKVNRLFAFVTETYAAAGSALVVGTTGSATAFFTGAIPNATALGTVYEITMNGAGAGKDPLADGNSDYLVGGSTGYQLTAAIVGGTGAAGKFTLFAELIPVSGTRFSG